MRSISLSRNQTMPTLAERIAELDAERTAIRSRLSTATVARGQAERAYFRALEAERNATAELARVESEMLRAVGIDADTERRARGYEAPTLANGRW